jgi:hypothetical protein
MDVNIFDAADGGKVVRVQLSDPYSAVNKEMALTEAKELRGQIKKSLERDPGAKNLQVSICGELYRLDFDNARLLLARLPSDQPRMLGLNSRSIPSAVFACILVLSFAEWSLSSYMQSNTADEPNAEAVRLAVEIIQHSRSNPALLDLSLDSLAKDAGIAISSERRQQMAQLLADHPDTSFETVVETYGVEFPELKLMARRLDSYEFWQEKKRAGMKDANGGGSSREMNDPNSRPEIPAYSPPSKQIIERIPETEGQTSGEAVSSGEDSSQTADPSASGQTVVKQSEGQDGGSSFPKSPKTISERIPGENADPSGQSVPLDE